MTQKPRTAGTIFAALGRAVCYLFLFILAQTLVTVIYTLTIQLYTMLNPGSGIDLMGLIFACTDQISIISGAVTLVILAVFFLLRRKNPLKESGLLRTHGRYVFIGCGIAPIFYTVVTVVLGLLPDAWLADYAEASAALNQEGFLMVVATVIGAPIVEEVIFRGLILSRLNRALPGWLAVLLSALLFGVCHGQVVWIAYAFVLGVVFGFLALRARSIWPTLAAHLVFNGIGQLMVQLENSSLNPTAVLLALAGAGAAVCIITFIFIRTHPLAPNSSDT